MTLSTTGLVIGWIVAALGALGSITALAKVGAERRKITAEAERAGVDAAQVLTNTAMSLLAPSLDQGAAREEIAELRAEIATLRHT